MKLNTNTNILIVGLGVIGGGYAKALSKKGYKVKCITLNQKDIDYALEKGIIDEGSVSVDREEMRSMMRISTERRREFNKK